MTSKVVVCGVGLIGGSFALAIKSALASVANERQKVQIVGMGRTRAPLEQALQLGVIDAIATDWASALTGADLVLLGMPVGQMAPVMAAMAPHLEAHTLVTDGGSTKADVVAAARAAFGAHFPSKIGQFVPGHPIAGAEKSGVAAARANLYLDKRVVLTPLPENAPEAVRAVRTVWEICGAKVSELAPAEHDRVFAAVSHLPHLLAFALVHDLATRDNADQLFGFAASGFRDFTRIASSHPEMWRDICLANRNALLKELDAYMMELMKTRVLLASADSAGLEEMFDVARTRRDAWLDALENAA
ncbi:MAG: prephenate dehydrogenase/arogenate dehydrogenase family protein [Gammaproteobacteria bacterium]|nr:prephenate dehydrogenase/arogenate dehydrogenase family protein [Rhodocyclaceae bacterium]MBU3908515.1 prephenate dehydrogenase/arogenate dehydrogenase family protein [Gammaproteobacteria bacterium]MBU3990496.1 prephenate dehydrogenase/arogenate dehydrogenase family protein [Gammaproteobacteria bacterium]MBU4004543.1 prephenate dehydrogenase/arogenate dehydrogenase family protein [Gammaproteobacteria bacterium]MBU4021146.1 prephenate dehydrogenase/arogenate dehydrogenase family protein [Gamm